jgi:hypothetical protein
LTLDVRITASVDIDSAPKEPWQIVSALGMLRDLQAIRAMGIQNPINFGLGVHKMRRIA